MSTRNSTPTSSPNPKTVRLEAPSTPPTARARKRLSAGLSTPDALHDSVPFSPGMKRSSSGSARSPDSRLGDAVSPYSAHNLLKTPGFADDDGETTPRRTKLMKTPQYFSPGKRLFADDTSPSKKELGEISSQLKSRLSSAFGSLQKDKTGSGISPVKLDFTSGPYLASKESPTRMAPVPAERANLARTNINLQMLQASPRIDTRPASSDQDMHSFGEPSYSHQIAMPSPDEESSAQNALMMALSRAKERRKSHTGDHRRGSFGSAFTDQYSQNRQQANSLKLPPISIRSPPKSEGASEQDAVYSLMSLASPQSNKHDFGSFHAAPIQASAAESSRGSSRASSVAMPVLPPVAGLIRRVDDDETDVEDATGSDDETASN
ncbi:hypothetical protein OXX80_012515 [Metschnikowia pulcherrima]